MKKRIFAAFLVLAMVLNLTVLSGCGKKIKDTGDYVTRGEWLAMLAEGFGLDSSDTNTPYFKDIPAGHTLFSAIQGLGDWAVLTPLTGDALDADKPVTRQEVAATAAIAAGFKLREDFQTEQAVQFAAQYGILEADGDGITQEECEAALEAAQNVYLENPGEEKRIAVMNPDLINLSSIPLDYVQANNNTVSISASVIDRVAQDSTGDTVVVIRTENGTVEMKAGKTFVAAPAEHAVWGNAYKILSIQALDDGSVTLMTTPPDLGDVYDDLEIHTTVSLEDAYITWADGVVVEPINGVHGLSAGNGEYHIELLGNSTGGGHHMPPPNTFRWHQPVFYSNKTAPFVKKFNNSVISGEAAEALKSSGFTYNGTPSIKDFAGSISTWTDELDKDTDSSFGYEITGDIAIEVSATTDVDYHKLELLGQEIRTWPRCADLSATATVSADLKWKGTCQLKESIAKIEIPIGHGFFVTGELILFVEASGSIQAKVEFDGVYRSEWSDSAGYREPVVRSNVDSDLSGAMDLSASTNIVLGLEFFGINLIGTELKISGLAEASGAVVGECEETVVDGVPTRNYTEALRFGLDFYAPIVTATVRGPKHIAEAFGLEKKFAIITKEQALCFHLWDKEFPFWSQIVTLDENGEVIYSERELTNTYTTKFGEIGHVNYPAFCFDYPDGWTVTKESVDHYYEYVTLENGRGATIQFEHMGENLVKENGGGSGALRMSYDTEASKTAEAQFIPSPIQGRDYSDLGSFVVAQVKTTGGVDYAMGFDDSFSYDEASIHYALLPESQMGKKTEYLYSQLWARSRFWYGGHISFTAYAPIDGFATQEEGEVIRILASFRVNEGDAVAASAAVSTLAALQNSDFSAFAGRYVADQTYAQNYACTAFDLILNTDGTLSGGGYVDDWDDSSVPDQYTLPAANTPTAIREWVPGAFACILWESEGSPDEPGSKGNETYTIYPVGVSSGRSNENTNTVRIHYELAAGGVWDMWYTRAN